MNRPDLAASALTIGSIIANSNGSWTIPVSFVVTNVGTATAQPIWYDVGYLSADAVLDGNESDLRNSLSPVHAEFARDVRRE